MIDQFCNIKIFMENGRIKKLKKFNSSKIFFYTGNHNKIAGIADIIDYFKNLCEKNNIKLTLLV